MDVSGESHIEHTGLKKVSIDKEGRLLKKDESASTIAAETTTSAEKRLELNETAVDFVKCLSCYGAEASNIKCCNTCDDVRRAYRQKNWQFSPYGVEQCKNDLHENGRHMQASELSRDPHIVQKLLDSGEGCQLEGHLLVNKVAGNFHIAPGISIQQNHMHFHDIKNMDLSRFNTKHFFEAFSFGDEYPNQMNPLERKSYKFDNTIERSTKNTKQDLSIQNVMDFGFFQLFQDGGDANPAATTNAISYSYFLKIVPTTCNYLLLNV